MHTLQFNEQHLQVLNAALLEMPFKVAAPVIAHINVQLQAAHDASADARNMPSGATTAPDQFAGS